MSTKIEWTDETHNPTTGCKKLSPGCKNCYAERLAPKVFAGQTITVDGVTRPRKFTDVMLHPERIDQPLHWKRPRMIFVDSMSDLFQDEVPDEFIDSYFGMMGLCEENGLGHTFQLLTKRAERMRDYVSTRGRHAWNARRLGPSRWPAPNIWFGVSTENQEEADKRIPFLLRTPAAVRFLSCEPLIGRVDLCETFNMWWNSTMQCFESYSEKFNSNGREGQTKPGIDWVIAGGESGSKARPSHPDWLRSLRDQCAAASVPFFFKQWGEWLGAMQDGAPGEEQRINASDNPIRVGKKCAGRLLDGQLHDEYPA